MKKEIIYFDKEKNVGLSVSLSEFKGKNYIHIAINMYDPDDDYWYRIKGLSLTEDYLDFLIEGLQNLEPQLAKINLPDVRQLELDIKGWMND